MTGAKEKLVKPSTEGEVEALLKALLSISIAPPVKSFSTLRCFSQLEEMCCDFDVIDMFIGQSVRASWCWLLAVSGKLITAISYSCGWFVSM